MRVRVRAHARLLLAGDVAALAGFRLAAYRSGALASWNLSASPSRAPGRQQTRSSPGWCWRPVRPLVSLDGHRLLSRSVEAARHQTAPSRCEPRDMRCLSSRSGLVLAGAHRHRTQQDCAPGNRANRTDADLTRQKKEQMPTWVGALDLRERLTMADERGPWRDV